MMAKRAVARAVATASAAAGDDEHEHEHSDADDAEHSDVDDDDADGDEHPEGGDGDGDPRLEWLCAVCNDSLTHMEQADATLDSLADDGLRERVAPAADALRYALLEVEVQLGYVTLQYITLPYITVQ